MVDIVPIKRTERSFKFCGPTVWNCLPLYELRTVTNIAIFKSKYLVISTRHTSLKKFLVTLILHSFVLRTARYIVLYFSLDVHDNSTIVIPRKKSQIWQFLIKISTNVV